ncbi:hypothetical protein GCM10011344_07150 [Dokdonia pacifica]|uniref:Uncharacterized protein n=1 Tax=Dokdonia pacifica TaxID=1627892 RepID=A0A238Z0W5_9FLAO|nr:hypothetical protein [Dokdonia pacifica]GGG09139.1 hypothetical protein GCM10011344_07150 [Dokdonia pacifica]SNR76523.1 hypothetical protein SAMN06265376_102486 [Dokdonia pacifica]
MNTQTISQSDFPIKISSMVPTKGAKISNSSLGPNKVTNEFLPNPFDISVIKNSTPTINFSFKVYIDANNTSALKFMSNNAGTAFCLEYDHPEETPEYVYEYTITANSVSSSLQDGAEITLYLMDTDPITSSGKKATVQPPA